MTKYTFMYLKLATEAKRKGALLMKEKSYSISISFINNQAKPYTVDKVFGYDFDQDWVRLQGNGWITAFNKNAILQIAIVEESEEEH